MDQEHDHLLQAVLEINNRVLGFVLGIVTGLVIFLATLWLVFKGGRIVGPHLSLLAQFFSRVLSDLPRKYCGSRVRVPFGIPGRLGYRTVL
jgi:hypothetical protein